jgi:hypothetical protein
MSVGISDMVSQALGDVAMMMARYGSAVGVDDFATEEVAEEFRDALSLKYPPEGYGTWSSRARRMSGGRYQIEWRVDSCE